MSFCVSYTGTYKPSTTNIRRGIKCENITYAFCTFLLSNFHIFISKCSDMFTQVLSLVFILLAIYSVYLSFIFSTVIAMVLFK